MSSFFQNGREISPQPDNYVVPDFPSLYWPFPWKGDQAQFLYQTTDIWRFTLFWTLIVYGAIHATAALYACIMQWRSYKYIWLAPAVFMLVAALEAVIAGSVIGGLLGAIYNAGYFKMSTWVPFVWAIINALVVILSSFSIQGGL